MIFSPTALPGVFVIEAELSEDERGFFARTWCESEAAAHGIEIVWLQFNSSYTRHRGTLRGMHYQRAPHAEGKLIRVTSGAIHDVVVDLRPESATYQQNVAVQLTAQNRLSLYIPPAALAHGFLTLSDDTEVSYHMSAPYAPAAAAGVRWDDPAFGIQWPEAVRAIAERDAHYPDFHHGSS
ncbi:MAG: dTDP-4-dehydrorhamnose 3,5-epimerase [Burkholderiales bacterium]